MKCVLVTGATGGLGRNAVERLLARGIAVRATGRNRAIGAQLQAQGAQFTALDLAFATPEDLAPLLSGVDAVWHCAARASPWGSAQQFLQDNVHATRALLQVAGIAGVKRFVHVSTPAVYFDYAHRLNVQESFKPSQYAHLYAATKAQSEHILAGFAEQFPAMHCAIVRPRAIFGPHDQTLLPRLEKAVRHGVLRLPRGGQVLLDFTYAGNVVHAMWLASTVQTFASGTAFNITNHAPMTLKEVLQSLFTEYLQRPLLIKAAPYAAFASAAHLLQAWSNLSGKEPLLTPYSAGVLNYDCTLSNARAIEQLGYAPIFSMPQGLALTAQWRLQHG